MHREILIFHISSRAEKCVEGLHQRFEKKMEWAQQGTGYVIAVVVVILEETVTYIN